MTALPALLPVGSISDRAHALQRYRILIYLTVHARPVPHAELRKALGYGTVTVGLRCRELVRDGLVRGDGRVGWEGVGRHGADGPVAGNGEPTPGGAATSSGVPPEAER